MIFDEFSIKTLIRPVQDFPRPGVVFRDITPQILAVLFWGMG